MPMELISNITCFQTEEFTQNIGSFHITA